MQSALRSSLDTHRGHNTTHTNPPDQPATTHAYPAAAVPALTATAATATAATARTGPGDGAYRAVHSGSGSTGDDVSGLQHGHSESTRVASGRLELANSGAGTIGPLAGTHHKQQDFTSVLLEMAAAAEAEHATAPHTTHHAPHNPHQQRVDRPRETRSSTSGAAATAAAPRALQPAAAADVAPCRTTSTHAFHWPSVHSESTGRVSVGDSGGVGVGYKGLLGTGAVAWGRVSDTGGGGNVRGGLQQGVTSVRGRTESVSGGGSSVVSVGRETRVPHSAVGKLALALLESDDSEDEE